MVVEADESDGSFLKLPHQISVITNLDIEHLDFYKNEENLKKSFENFINMLPFYGTSIVCLDDKNLNYLIKNKTRNIITYSIKNKKADVLINNINQTTTQTSFKLKIINNKIKHSNEFVFTINTVGYHNILNGTASIIVSKLLGINNLVINKALKNYIGVKRRFTFLGVKK